MGDLGSGGPSLGRGGLLAPCCCASSSTRPSISTSSAFPSPSSAAWRPSSTRSASRERSSSRPSASSGDAPSAIAPRSSAAAIAAFYPELVWFASHFWAETVFTVLLWWAMERLLAADARASTGAALASGLLWGLAILTRETVLYFLPIAALWLAWRRTGGARRAAALLALSLLVVLPWTLRNYPRVRRVRARLDLRGPQPVAGQHAALPAGGLRRVLGGARQDPEVRARPRAARSRRSSSASPSGSSRSCATSSRHSGRRTASPSSTSSAGPTARSPARARTRRS